MLETALSDDLVAASNVSDAGPDTLWVHLLPTLAPDHVCWFGPPDPAISVLLDRAGRTTVLEVTGHDRTSRRRRVSSPCLPGSVPTPLSLDPPIDLALLPGGVASALVQRPAPLAAFLRSLAPGATVCVLPGPRSPRQVVRLRDIDQLAAAFEAGSLARLSPRAGVDDPAAGGLVVAARSPIAFRRSRARVRRLWVLLLQRVAHMAGRGPSRASRAHPSDIALHRPVAADRRRGRVQGTVLLRRNADMARVPQYLVRLAALSGVDLEGAHWAVAPPRGYRSQKIIFALTRRGASRPDFMVKMTQEPRFNVRLGNECRALEELTAVAVADELTVPRIVFAGTHAGLMVVGETALAGERFRAHSSATADCHVARAAILWLTELAVETIDRGQAAEPGLRALRTLADRYFATFETSPEERLGLSMHLEQLASRETIPAVVSHGDPGTWNLLVRPEIGRVSFLDWENFEASGMPGWDLTLFLKSFAGFVSEATGARRSMDKTLCLMSRPGPFNALVQASFHAYTERLQLDRDMLSSVVLMCWVHQSLKEATRLTPQKGHRNRSRQVVARCLMEPQLLAAMTGGRV